MWKPRRIARTLCKRCCQCLLRMQSRYQLLGMLAPIALDRDKLLTALHESSDIEKGLVMTCARRSKKSLVHSSADRW